MKIRIRKQSIFDIYLFIFIFTMVNREFVLFGLDLRYVQMLLSLFLICNRLVQLQTHTTEKIHLQSLEKNIVIFYVILFASNLFYLTGHSFHIVYEELISLNILHINNFLCLITFFIYRNKITARQISDYLKVSIIVLFISCCAVLFGVPISNLFATGARTSTIDTNLFGGNIRIAGFGEDANYTFLFFYTYLLISLYLEKQKRSYIMIAMCLFGMGFSFSKTQMIMIVPSVLIYLCLVKAKVNTRQKSMIMFFLITVIAIAPIVISGLKIFGGLSTMSTRYRLWNICLQMMEQNHYLPSGLGACRFYINSFFSYTWLVQSHSTYISLLCELGIVNIFLWITIFKKLLMQAKNVSFIIILNYLFFSITSETTHLQYFVFVIYLVSKFGETFSKRENIE